jgi:hypothetical protein
MQHLANKVGSVIVKHNRDDMKEIRETIVEENEMCGSVMFYNDRTNLVCKMLHAGQTCGNNITVYCDIPKILVRDRGSH